MEIVIGKSNIHSQGMQHLGTTYLILGKPKFTIFADALYSQTPRSLGPYG
jgi:hypothetical protein